METEMLSVSDLRLGWVVKANELILRSRYNLPLQQQKIVLFLISQVKPYDDDFKTYEFSIADFCRVCGMDETSGKNYQDIKTAIKEIADRSVWIETEDGTETLVRWIAKPYINKKSGTIRIRIDSDMKPYLLHQKKNFTKYEILWTLKFRSKYSPRLYELMKTVHYQELYTYQKSFTLDELRRLLGAETYTTYQTLKTRVLNPAMAEVNAFSDKIVSYEPIKYGRAVAKIRFTIGTKDVEDRLRLQSQIEHELGLNQLTLWDELEEKGLVNSSYEERELKDGSDYRN